MKSFPLQASSSLIQLTRGIGEPSEVRTPPDEVDGDRRRSVAGQLLGRYAAVEDDDQGSALGALGSGLADQGQRHDDGDRQQRPEAAATHPYLENLKLQ